MKKTFQFYKNIILVVASALTLVAVTFAWFSTANNNNFNAFSSKIQDVPVIDTAFYEKAGTEYVEMDGGIVLDSVVSGQYNQYRMVITTSTAEPVKLSVSINDLPADLDENLRQYVCIKYSLCKTTVHEDGTFTDGELITSSNDRYVPLSELADGIIFNGYSLSKYQESESDSFVLYYEIGLSEAAGSEVQGLSADLGNLSLNAQLAK
ncbi:MAG: hypothetical protein KBT46_02030 [Ruminococcus sp.]|nr:hypothetical protein [Candidatus Copronaster equi]